MNAAAVHIVPADSSTWSPPLPDVSTTGAVDAEFTHLVVETPGLRTHVATMGEGTPVVMLHGFPAHWWQWRAIAPAIADQGYRVICPDLRGAGWTSADDPRIQLTTRLDDLLALLEVLDVDRAHLVTHDMGAITGMHLAYAHPARVRTMVQLSVPPGFMSFSPKLMPGFAHLPRLLLHRPGRSLGKAAFGDRYLVHPLADSTRTAYLDVLQRPEVDGAVGRLCRRMVMPEAMRLMNGTYRRMQLVPPTLVAFGRQDHPWTEETVRQICRGRDRYAAQFELAFVEDAAHFITDDAPESVAELALRWFDQAETARTD